MSDDPDRGMVTQLLLDLGPDALAEGPARDRLIDLLYGELHRMASRLLQRERPDHTLQPTALINEAYLRLVDQSRTTYQNRLHFLSLAARTMRRILVDYARKTRSSKRGGQWQRVPLESDVAGNHDPAIDVLALDRALQRFAAADARAARVIELRVFGGLKIEEIASALDISRRTVDGDLAVGRMWLSRELTRADQVTDEPPGS